MYLIAVLSFISHQLDFKHTCLFSIGIVLFLPTHPGWFFVRRMEERFIRHIVGSVLVVRILYKLLFVPKVNWVLFVSGA